MITARQTIDRPMECEMYSLQILRSYDYRRGQQGMRAVDACADTAEWHGVSVRSFAAWLVAIEVDGGARGLSLV